MRIGVVIYLFSTFFCIIIDSIYIFVIFLPGREVEQFQVLNSDKATTRAISNYGEQ